MQESPAESGIELANWNWRAVRQFILEHFGISLSRGSCLNYLHRLGFAFKRPKKRLIKADAAKRGSFRGGVRRPVGRGAPVWGQDILRRRSPLPCGRGTAGQVGAEGRASLGGLQQPALRRKASYYSAVCLETGEVEWMELEGNSNSETSAAFLDRLRQRHPGPLEVIWDNAPAHRGEAVREYLRTPDLNLRLINLPGYSPDFNADEAVWGWAREEATGNLCLGTKASVQERVGNFLPRAVQPERRGQAPLPHHPAIKGRKISAGISAPMPTHGKCTSHLGFGLVLQRRFERKGP